MAVSRSLRAHFFLGFYLAILRSERIREERLLLSGDFAHMPNCLANCQDPLKLLGLFVEHFVIGTFVHEMRPRSDG